MLSHVCYRQAWDKRRYGGESVVDSLSAAVSYCHFCLLLVPQQAASSVKLSRNSAVCWHARVLRAVPRGKWLCRGEQRMYLMLLIAVCLSATQWLNLWMHLVRCGTDFSGCVPERVKYKLCLIVFKAVYGTTRDYLSELCRSNAENTIAIDPTRQHTAISRFNIPKLTLGLIVFSIHLKHGCPWIGLHVMAPKKVTLYCY